MALRPDKVGKMGWQGGFFLTFGRGFAIIPDKWRIGEFVFHTPHNLPTKYFVVGRGDLLLAFCNELW